MGSLYSKVYRCCIFSRTTKNGIPRALSDVTLKLRSGTDIFSISVTSLYKNILIEIHIVPGNQNLQGTYRRKLSGLV